MDRLTDKDYCLEVCSGCDYNGEPNGCNHPNGTCKVYDMLQEFAEELNKYYATGLSPEQLKEVDRMYLKKCEEVNRLTKLLPVFSTGDTAYYVDVQEKEIEELTIDLVIAIRKPGKTDYFYDSGILRFCNADVGKILFADEKQAEKKLKKVKKEDITNGWG